MCLSERTNIHSQNSGTYCTGKTVPQGNSYYKVILHLFHNFVYSWKHLNFSVNAYEYLLCYTVWCKSQDTLEIKKHMNTFLFFYDFAITLITFHTCPYKYFWVQWDPSKLLSFLHFNLNFFASERLTSSPTYLYKKDESTLPGDLRSLKYISFPITCSVSHYPPNFCSLSLSYSSG
jgi:hypothetical protein